MKSAAQGLSPKISAGILVLIFAGLDIFLRRQYIAEFSREDDIVYGISLIFEYFLLYAALAVFCRNRLLGAALLIVYSVLIFCSYCFLFYFNTLPGINTFSFLFHSPVNSLSIAADGITIKEIVLGVVFISGLLYGLHFIMHSKLYMGKLGVSVTFISGLVLLLVLNNNLRLRDNRTLPFTNALFSLRYGYEDFKNSGKLDRIGNRSFILPVNSVKKEAGFNILLLVNESLSPYYFSAYGSKYAPDSVLSSFRASHQEEVYLFQDASSNATVTAISVPFLAAGLNPAEGMMKLIGSPLLPDLLKANFNNIRTAHITSWSYDDYPDFKNFFNSPALDYYIYREKIKADKVVDMGTNDSVIVSYFSGFLNTINKQEHFAATLHFSNTHYPYFPQDYSGLFNSAEKSVNGYLSSLKKLDTHLGEIIQLLKSSGRLDNTIIISTSDHSESLGEFFTMQGHFGKFNTWNTRIPFWMYVPAGLMNNAHLGNLKANTELPISNNDIVPTILNAYGLSYSGMGNSLLNPLQHSREIYIYNGKGENRTDSKEYFGVIRGDTLVVITADGESAKPEMFLRNDLYQERNLWESYPAKDYYLTQFRQHLSARYAQLFSGK